jgi:hypothetical protein
MNMPRNSTGLTKLLLLHHMLIESPPFFAPDAIFRFGLHKGRTKPDYFHICCCFFLLVIDRRS